MSSAPRLPAIALAGLAASPLVSARETLETGHMDIAISFDGGEWSVELASDEVFPPLRYAPEDAVLVAKDLPYAVVDGRGSRVMRPAAESWDFLGVEPGEEFWLLPNAANGGEILEPGWSTESIAGNLVASPIRIELLGHEYRGAGDGHFSMWTGAAGGPGTVHFATLPAADGVATGFYSISAGDHRHSNWGFSAIGLYQLTFRASALTVAGDESSRSTGDPFTLTFSVGLDPFERWLAEAGVAEEDWTEAGNPAGDGVPNLLKYAFGLDPLRPLEGPLAEANWLEEAGETYLALDLAPDPAARGISLRVEWSEDLEDWSSAASEVRVIEDGPGRLLARSARPLVEGGAGFLRLVVERDRVEEEQDD